MPALFFYKELNMKHCYEVVKHERGQQDFMDQVVTSDKCCTKEQAEVIADRLNNTSNKLVKANIDIM